MTSSSDLLIYATTGWGVLMAASPVLQIRAMLRSGESRDVSIGMFCVMTIGFSLWLAYGVTFEQPAIWICNIVALIVSIATTTVAVRLRRRHRRLAETGDGRTS